MTDLRSHRVTSAYTARWRGRRRARGMTLIEIMVVIIIMAAIATAVGVAVLPMIEQAKIDTTYTATKTIKGAASLYVARSSDCPTVADLVDRGLLDADQKTTDEWDQEFQIECEGTQIIVISGGPDVTIGNEDDIRSDREPQVE